MILVQPKYTSNMISSCNRAIVDGVGRPSANVLRKINGLMYRLRHNLVYNFIDNRECYFNFRHDGPEAFNYYNMKGPGSLSKIVKVGTVTHVPNSHVAFNGASGYYNTFRALGFYGFYPRTSNAHHWGLKAALSGVTYPWGVNMSAVRYTMVSGDVRMNCNSVDAVVPTIPGLYRTAGKNKVGRLSATIVALNKDGAFIENITQAEDGAALASNPIYLGCRNHFGTADGVDGVGLTYYSHGGVTTDANDLMVYNAEVAYEASLLELPL